MQVVDPDLAGAYSLFDLCSALHRPVRAQMKSVTGYHIPRPDTIIHTSVLLQQNRVRTCQERGGTYSKLWHVGEVAIAECSCLGHNVDLCEKSGKI